MKKGLIALLSLSLVGCATKHQQPYSKEYQSVEAFTNGSYSIYSKSESYKIVFPQYQLVPEETVTNKSHRTDL